LEFNNEEYQYSLKEFSTFKFSISPLPFLRVFLGRAGDRSCKMVGILISVVCFIGVYFGGQSLASLAAGAQSALSGHR